jgi:predicted DCC family thiol-disulfide oxidoreductase YuxK
MQRKINMTVDIDNAKESDLLMMFDGVCVFCSRSVKFVSDHADNNKIEFCPMQSEEGKAILKSIGMPTENYDTLVVINNGEVYTRSRAIIMLMQSMRGCWPLFASVLQWIPVVLLDKAYDILASNRYNLLGQTEFCYLPERNS